jgi:hypothetical protein
MTALPETRAWALALKAEHPYLNSGVRVCLACTDARRRREHEALLARIERMWNVDAAALGRKGVHSADSDLQELRRAGRLKKRAGR